MSASSSPPSRTAPSSGDPSTLRIGRRRLLGLGATALGAFTLLPPLRRATGNADCRTPPLVITLRAGGGWDPTYCCDPIVDDPRFTPFTAADVLQAEGIRYAPFDVDDGTRTPYRVNGQDFFAKHAGRMVVVNGVDHETVAHDVGSRVSMSGSSRLGLPTLSGLVAGIAGRSLPLAYLVSGGYASAQSMVPLIRVAGGDTLRQILIPNGMGSRADDPVHEAEVESLIAAARWERDARLAPDLPSAAHTVAQIRNSRGAALDERFRTLLDGLEATAVDSENDAVQTASAILAAMRAGACAAAHLTYNGVGSQFDTHDRDHGSLDPRAGHRPALAQLFEAADYLLDTVEGDEVLGERGLVLVIGSEFGRTVFNPDRGKDHWNIGSTIVMTAGAAADRMEPGRAVGWTGATTPDGTRINGAYGYKVKVVSGELTRVDDEDDPDAFRLTAKHVHVAIRDMLDLCDDHLPDSPLTTFRVPDVSPEPLPLFRS